MCLCHRVSSDRRIAHSLSEQQQTSLYYVNCVSTISKYCLRVISFEGYYSQKKEKYHISIKKMSRFQWKFDSKIAFGRNGFAIDKLNFRCFSHIKSFNKIILMCRHKFLHLEFLVLCNSIEIISFDWMKEPLGLIFGRVNQMCMRQNKTKATIAVVVCMRCLFVFIRSFHYYYYYCCSKFYHCFCLKLDGFYNMAIK